MKHRGRHRRRKRGQALRAALAGAALALTAAATLISASQATVADDPGALKPLTSPAQTAELQLRERLVARATLDRLTSAMGRPVGVEAVLDSADRSLREAAGCSSADRESLPVAPAAAHAYCWDPADSAATGWSTTSVTTSADADDDGRWGARRVVLAGSALPRTAASARAASASGATPAPAAERGLARVAFIDADRGDRLAYRWVLLVVPTADGSNYHPLASRISGMVWYQDKLLVTAGSDGPTSNALYVYDLKRILRTTVDGTAIGRVPGGWSADGYQYVMPAVGTYRLSGGPCSANGSPCPGSISLDRGTAPDSLVVGERTPAGDRRARLARYSFSADPARAGLLATDAAGRADAVEAYRTRASDIRGVLSYHPGGGARTEWYVVRPPREGDGHGSLWRQTAKGARPTRCGADSTHHCWSERTGSLSYAGPTGEVWSVTDRMLFRLPLDSIDGSLG